MLACFAAAADSLRLGSSNVADNIFILSAAISKPRCNEDEVGLGVELDELIHYKGGPDVLAERCHEHDNAKHTNNIVVGLCMLVHQDNRFGGGK